MIELGKNCESLILLSKRRFLAIYVFVFQNQTTPVFLDNPSLEIRLAYGVIE
jgi:hypothetical protein